MYFANQFGRYFVLLLVRARCSRIWSDRWVRDLGRQRAVAGQKQRDLLVPT